MKTHGLFRGILAVGTVVVLLAQAPATAAIYTWDGGAGTNAWGTSANWVGDPVAPVSAVANVLVFTGSVQTATNNNIVTSFDLNSLQFNSGASAFTVTGSSLEFRTSGVTPTILQDSANAQSVANNLILTNNTAVTVSGAGTLTLSGALSGAGTLTKNGAGTLTLSGASTIGSTVTVNDGTLSILTGGSLATTGNGTFTVASGAAVTSAGSISISSVSTLTVGGTLTMTAGTLSVTRGNGGDLGQITSGGSILLQGSSIFSIGGNTNAYYIVGNGGILDVGPSATVSGIDFLRVDSGGTLRGSGTSSSRVTISAGGHLAPGTSVGKFTFSDTLTLSGNYDWQLGALKSDTTVPAATPGTDYDLVKLTAGNVVATGSTLNLSFSGAAAGGPTSNSLWHSSQSWKVIDNQGAGTLTGLPSVASGNYPNKGSFGIAASGNDVVLSWTSAAAATIGLTATPVDSTIITSGTTTVNVAVSNTAAGGAWDLNYAYTTGDGLAGSGSGTKAVGAAADNLALTFTGGATGSHGSVNVSDTFATNDSQTRNSLVTVLDHSNAMFTDDGGSGAKALSNNNDDLEIDFGSLAPGGNIDSFFDVFAQVVVTDLTAKLDLDLISSSGDTGVLAVIGKVAFSDLAAGQEEDYTGRFDTSATPASYLATYVFKLSDQNLPGASAAQSELLTLTLKGTVTPEPATMALLGLGGLCMGLARMRGRKRAA
jgi:autotransporter-associated beta strand protein